jgi:hypothetical protein
MCLNVPLEMGDDLMNSVWFSSSSGTPCYCDDAIRSGSLEREDSGSLSGMVPRIITSRDAPLDMLKLAQAPGDADIAAALKRRYRSRDSGSNIQHQGGRVLHTAPASSKAIKEGASMLDHAAVSSRSASDLDKEGRI